jgi:hypothetical protein
MLSNVKPSTVEESPRSSGAEEWGLENRRPYIDRGENSSGSQSDQSEDNEENGQPMDEEYDDQPPAGYSRAYSGGSRPHGMMDDETEEDDEEAEGDAESDDDDVDEDELNHAAADVDDEMDEDDDIGDDGDDGGDGVEANADEDATSYSSEYSE